jgi:hypothetical protein
MSKQQNDVGLDAKIVTKHRSWVLIPIPSPSSIHVIKNDVRQCSKKIKKLTIDENGHCYGHGNGHNNNKVQIEQTCESLKPVEINISTDLPHPGIIPGKTILAYIETCEANMFLELKQIIEQDIIDFIQKELKKHILELENNTKLVDDRLFACQDHREPCGSYDCQCILDYHQSCIKYYKLLTNHFHQLEEARSSFLRTKMKYDHQQLQWKDTYNKLCKELRKGKYIESDESNDLQKQQIMSKQYLLIEPSILDASIKYFFSQIGDARDYFPIVCWKMITEYLTNEDNFLNQFTFNRTINADYLAIHAEVQNKYIGSCENQCCATYGGVCYKDIIANTSSDLIDNDYIYRIRVGTGAGSYTRFFCRRHDRR